MSHLLGVQCSPGRETGSVPVSIRAWTTPSGTAPILQTCSRGRCPASWPHRIDPGGSRGLDDYLTRDYAHNIRIG